MSASMLSRIPEIFREHQSRMSTSKKYQPFARPTKKEEQRAEQARMKVQDRSKLRQLNRSNGKDSGVDVSEGEDCGNEEENDSGSLSVELRTWILNSFAIMMAKWAPPDRKTEESTLYEWYRGPTDFFDLKIKRGKLTPELLESTEELNERIELLIPQMVMPKYICSMDVPWFDVKDLIVQSEVSLPEPAHLGKVVPNPSRGVFFFKPVDTSQPGAIKREIQILQRLESLNLKVKAPKLRGFVRFGDSTTKTMGFLLSNIANPKPLTVLLDSNISRTKRARWSATSKDYVRLLHENQIIWGDAKADNLLVDAHDELWIIDFGGSYTEGWVESNLNETKDGDTQGLEKIQAALEIEKSHNSMSDSAHTGQENVRETASSLFVAEKRNEIHTWKRKYSKGERHHDKKKRN